MRQIFKKSFHKLMCREKIHVQFTYKKNNVGCYNITCLVARGIEFFIKERFSLSQYYVYVSNFYIRLCTHLPLQKKEKSCNHSALNKTVFIENKTLSAKGFLNH